MAVCENPRIGEVDVCGDFIDLSQARSVAVRSRRYVRQPGLYLLLA